MENAKYYLNIAMKNENYKENALSCLLDDFRTDLEYAIQNTDDYSLVAFWNEYCENTCCSDEMLFAVDEIDDIFGQMYPSECMEKFSDVDFSDGWFKADLTESGDYPERMIDVENLVDSVIDGDYYSEAPAEIDDLIEQYNETIAEIEDILFTEEQEAKKREKAISNLMDVVTMVCGIGTVNQIESAISALWNLEQ